MAARRETLKRAIGLMSGTSGDGVDAAMLDTDGENRVEFVGGLTIPYGDDLQTWLLEASQHDVPIVELLRLEREITECHVEAVRRLIANHPSSEKVEVIGFHGHTVRHVSGEALTLQIGNPWLLRSALDIPVVSDFRRHDMAVGGQGAPLAAMFHRAIFAGESRPTVVLNLGGVANVTWLGDDDQIIAGDTGPGCGLLDEWVQEMAGQPHDRDGKLAKAGRVHEGTVQSALSTPFFAKTLPKAADRYDFDHVDVSHLSVEDGAATLCAVTVEAIFRAVKKLPAIPSTLWVTGGGVHHPVIMELLAKKFKQVRTVSERGLNADTLEAECFAWLAVRRLLNLPISIPQTTGCSKPVSGGMLTC